ncbi:Uncharacterised protein [Vibrio cholerae]|nr:Uncharacterised protein [Vibrio cholerae]
MKSSRTYRMPSLYDWRKPRVCLNGRPTLPSPIMISCNSLVGS